MASEEELAAIKTRNNLEEGKTDEAFVSISNRVNPRSIEFSAKEQEILDLYDALQELRLENALIEAQAAQGRDFGLENDAKTLEEAEQAHLQARAAYALSESVIKNVLQADPILKAIHSGENATPIERSLQPLVDQRDVLSLVQTNLSKRLQTVNNDLVLVRIRNLNITNQNRALSKSIVDLGKLSEVTAEKIDDPALKSRLDVLRSTTGEEKRKYRIIKSLASGIVAGSGFDWADDDELRGMVLDEED